MSKPVTDGSMKVYTQPQLQVYGDLREITQSVMTAGKKTDNEIHPNRSKM